MTQTYCILLVDDSEVQQELWVPILELEGFKVLSARNGTQALELVGREEIDVVLLDVRMPGLDGFEVLQRIRESHTTEDLAVIMATSNDRDEDIVKAFRLGANDYVTHPLNREVTIARIWAQLRNRLPAARRRLESGGEASIGPGTVLEGRYCLEEMLGQGNFGSVYRGVHLQLQRAVAIKVLRTRFSVDEVALARFQQEGVSLSRLEHPNAVSVLDFSVTRDDVTYLVMELLDGETLEASMRRTPNLSVQRTASVAVQVCDVLAEAHRLGIIHRDIKPQNIFLHQGRNGEIVKVVDFGIAKLVGEVDMGQQLTIDGNSVGTPAYMAPERFTNEAYDGRVDVYSLGVAMFEMLAGRPLFVEAQGNFFKLIRMHVIEKPPRLGDVNTEVPKALDELVMAMLAKRCQDRPTAAELGDQLVELFGIERRPAAIAARESLEEESSGDPNDAFPPAPPTLEWRKD